MKKTDAKLQPVGDAPAWDEELRLWLASWVADHLHLTPAVLARPDHIGAASRTMIDSYLKCTYFGRPHPKTGKIARTENSKLEPLVRAYRDRVEGSTRSGVTNLFIKTRAWQQFKHACHTAITELAIVVAYSAPGVGKSRCMLEYAVQNMTTMPIQILCSANFTTRFFLQKIAQTLGLSLQQPIAVLEDSIATKLKSHPRPLFVDQANYLNEKALGATCHIWEVAHIPIVLIGTKDLYDLFNSSRMTQDVRAQLSSRVKMHYPLEGLELADVKTIVERVMKDKATPEVVAKIYEVTGGNHRALEFIFPRIDELTKYRKNAEELAAGKPGKMSEIICAAGSRLMVA